MSEVGVPSHDIIITQECVWTQPGLGLGSGGQGHGHDLDSGPARLRLGKGWTYCIPDKHNKKTVK